jgi:hypothetical protein
MAQHFGALPATGRNRRVTDPTAGPAVVQAANHERQSEVQRRLNGLPLH